MIANVTFTCYYEYEVKLPDTIAKLYEDDPQRVEDFAIERAYEGYCETRRTPITSYNEVEVEIQ